MLRQKKCENCNTETSGTNISCENCGAPFELGARIKWRADKESKPMNREGMVYMGSKSCPKCNTDNPAKSKFCANCGVTFQLSSQMPLATCPACSNPLSPTAYDCPRCGHILKTPSRGPFGQIVKYVFILFHLGMLVWMLSICYKAGESVNNSSSQLGEAAAVVGGGIGGAVVLVIWVLGSVIIGFIVLATRPRKK